MWEIEKTIETYYGKYKKSGLFGKQSSINLFIYSSHIAGKAFEYHEGNLSDDSCSFDIPYQLIKRMYIGEIKNDVTIMIEYKKDSVVQDALTTIVLIGMDDPLKWIQLIEETKKNYLDELNRKKALEIDEERRRNLQKEEDALNFYEKCYAFHIKETTPVYQLFTDKNRTAILYIDENKGLNFLKIDGYAKEEYSGVIIYDNIHYYERAGSVHYATDIHGNHSVFGGSITGGNFSKLAAMGGGLLFGLMGMAAGALLTYEPMEQKPFEANFSIDSDIKKIDDRNVILNFYSDSREQYIDIELPYDVYNFLLTYLPEKKYSIVDELEKKAAISQSEKVIRHDDLLNVSASQDVQRIETANENSDVLFEQKIKKLKMMKEAGLLSEEEFDHKRKELIEMI